MNEAMAVAGGDLGYIADRSFHSLYPAHCKPLIGRLNHQAGSARLSIRGLSLLGEVWRVPSFQKGDVD